MKMGYVGIALLAIIVACNRSNHTNTENPPQKDVQSISAALAQDQVEKVEILQIPPRILTRAQVSAEILETHYHNKLIIRDITASAFRSKMIDILKGVSVQSRREMADLRWGVIFYSRDGKRIGALYYERSGRYGAVNGVPVEFQGDFFRWLDGTFSNCMQ